MRAAGLRAEMKVLETQGGHLDGLTQISVVKDGVTPFLASD